MPQEHIGFLVPGLFFTVFPLMWYAILKLLGATGGWSRLGRLHAPPPSGPPLHRFRFASGMLGIVSYSSVMNVAIYPDAIYLSVLLPFRVGHPALLVPRSEIRDGKLAKTWFGMQTFSFRVDDVQFGLSLMGSGMARQLAEWFGQNEP